jgi:hypothetical protein
MKKLLLLVVLMMAASVASVHAEMTPGKRAEIEKLLRLTGMEKLMGQMMTQMTSSMSNGMPGIPPEFWAKFQAKMNMRELLDRIIPVYDKYYSLEDIRAINAFYESPTGQKILASMPQVMQECMQIGQDWGKKIGEQAEKEAREEIQKKKRN